MDIAFVLYPDMTALDVVGPVDVLAPQPGVVPHFVAATRETVRCDSGLLLEPTTTFAELDRPDVVVVPGGSAGVRVLRDRRLVDWVRVVHETTAWTTSVCTGALVLAEAGVLTGRPATTHWLLREELAARGAVVSTDRVVRDGRVITAAGVSAGIDMALTLTGLLFGDDRAELTQLMIEYDPRPPYDAGRPDTAPPAIVALARELSAASE